MFIEKKKRVTFNFGIKSKQLSAGGANSTPAQTHNTHEITLKFDYSSN